MSKRIIATVTYRGSNSYGRGLDAEKIAVFQRGESVVVEISGAAGGLSSARLTMPEPVALALGGALLSAAAGAGAKAELAL